LQSFSRWKIEPAALFEAQPVAFVLGAARIVGKKEGCTRSHTSDDIGTFPFHPEGNAKQ